MKHWNSLLLAGICLMLAGCTMEEHRDWGVLQLQVDDAQLEHTTIEETQIILDGALVATHTFSEETRELSIANLNLDASHILSIRAQNYEVWNDTLNFSGGEKLNLSAQLVREHSGSGFRTTIRTFTSDGVEVSGLPLEVNGQPIGFQTPTLVDLDPNLPNSIEVRKDDCTRGAIQLTLNADSPERVDTLWVTDMELVVESDNSAATILLNGQTVDPVNGKLINVPPNSLLSAWLPGHVFQPGASTTLSGMCDPAVSFNWQVITEGYLQDNLFPEFALENTTGELLEYNSMRGNVVLVNFWFINCVPCQEELPLLQDMLTTYFDDGFRILGLNPVEGLESQAQWVIDHPEYSLTVLPDLSAAPVAGSAGITFFPTNFLVDRRGVIRQVAGELTEESFEPLLQQLLAE